jgi:Caspase domain/Protein of unknown function (DUF1566)
MNSVKWIIPGLVILALLIPTSPLAKERRVALVIGNGAYKDSPLRNPVNDAADVSSALRHVGFEVINLIDAPRRDMEEAINKLGRKLREGGTGLFYFAGHGVQVDGINYLIPVGGNIETEGDVKFEAVNANRVLSKMQDSGNPLNIVFLDACRNNPFARMFRSAQQGLAPMDAPKGSLVAFATAPGNTAADGTGRNGVFTKHLLKQMAQPGLEIGPMMRQVRVGVQNDTGDKQTPFEVSSMTGNFYFAPAAATATPAASIAMSNLEMERQKLDQERRELERLKVEMEERKRIDTERKQIQDEKKIYASIGPSTKGPKITARDGHFVQYENGIVFDEKTGLEWYFVLYKRLNWHDAHRWVENLSANGGGWRMPSTKELSSLMGFDGIPNLIFEGTNPFVWSKNEKDAKTAWGFYFSISHPGEGWEYKKRLRRCIAIRLGK